MRRPEVEIRCPFQGQPHADPEETDGYDDVWDATPTAGETGRMQGHDEGEAQDEGDGAGREPER